MAKHIHLVLDLESGDVTGLALPVDAGSPSGSATAVLGFGAGDVGSSTRVRYLHSWNSDQLSQVQESGFYAPRDGTLKNLFVRHKNPSGNGNSIIYTVRVASVDSALLIAVPSNVSTGFNISDSVAVNKGDLISVKVTKPFSIGTSPNDITVTAEFE